MPADFWSFQSHLSTGVWRPVDIVGCTDVPTMSPHRTRILNASFVNPPVIANHRPMYRRRSYVESGIGRSSIKHRQMAGQCTVGSRRRWRKKLPNREVLGALWHPLFGNRLEISSDIDQCLTMSADIHRASVDSHRASADVCSISKICHCSKTGGYQASADSLTMCE